MARIRSVKPEFWSSPDLPDDPWVRLLYIAMWNWADDNGVGTAIPRELLGFAFPNDEHLTVVDLRRMLVEIRRVFGVTFYEVAGRPYYAIPSWERHQKFDRRSKGKHPGPEEAESPVRWMKTDYSTETHESPPSARRDSVAGTGEQGNRGTEEQGNSSPSSEVADAPIRHDVEELLDLLDSEIATNGGRIPTRTKKNRDAMRLLLDRDGHTPEQIERAIRWCQGDEFWRANILSASKLREKYDQLRLAATRNRGTQPNRAHERQEHNLGVVERMAALDAAEARGIGQ